VLEAEPQPRVLVRHLVEQQHVVLADPPVVHARVERHEQPVHLRGRVHLAGLLRHHVESLVVRVELDPLEPEVGDLADLLDEVAAGEVDRPEPEQPVRIRLELGREPPVVMLVHVLDLLRERCEADRPLDAARVEVAQQPLHRPVRVDGGGKDVGVVGEDAVRHGPVVLPHNLPRGDGPARESRAETDQVSLPRPVLRERAGVRVIRPWMLDVECSMLSVGC
jgi:hypothetical protein